MENFKKNKNSEGYYDPTASKAIKNVDGGGRLWTLEEVT